MTNQPIYQPIPYQQEYRDYLEIECGCQPRTIIGYLEDLRVFFRYLQEYQFPPAEEVDPTLVRQEHLRAFLAYLEEERGNSPYARNRKQSSIKSYYKFLVLHGWLEQKDNPARRLKKAKIPYKLPVVLSLEEAQALLKAARMKSFLPYRDYAMLQLFLQTGLRLDELLQLETGDINLQEKQIIVRGKGDKERLLPLTQATVEALDTHLERRLPPSPPSEKVFINHRGKPLTWRGVQRIFDRICEQAGLLKPGLSPHKLRHTCMTLLHREGVDLMTLKELAGHEDIASTEIYAHVNLDDLRHIVKKHPLG